MLLRFDGQEWTDIGPGFGRNIVDVEWFDDGSALKLYATGQPPSHGDPDELHGFGRWNGQRWEPVATERTTSPTHLCVHDDGTGSKLYGMRYDMLTVWDGQTWTEFELTEYTETAVGSLVSVEANGKQELIWGGNGGRNDIGRVWRWNGVTDELIGEADGEIKAVIADTAGELGGGVFVVGDFRHVNGVSAVNVAHWDGVQWRDVGTAEQGNGVRLPDSVLAIGPDADPRLANRVFVAPAWDVGGQECGGFAAWDGSRWECIDTPPFRHFWARHMLHCEWQGKERVIVAGRIGLTYDDNGIAMWDGESWEYIPSPLEPGSEDIAAFAIGELDGRRVMVAGGAFRDYYNVGGNLLIYDGQEWSRLGKGFNEPIGSAVFFDDGSGPALYVSGRFTMAGGRPVAQVARWDGRRWHQVGDGLTYNGYPQSASLEVVDTGEGPRLYARGWISHSGSTRLYNIARWNGQQWKPVGTNLASWPPRRLFALDTGDGLGLAAIASTNHNGKLNHGIMNWSGGQWQLLADGFNSGVNDVSVSPTDPRAFYLGGYFTRIGDTPSEGFAEYIPSARICTADFDCNGLRDTRDIVEYVEAWASGEDRADMDGDGVLTEMDFLLFMAEWRYFC